MTVGGSCRAGERADGGLGALAGGRVVQGGQEPHELPGRAVPVDRVDDVEQGCPRHAPGDQEQGVGAAGDDLGQERDRGFARERGQDGDLMRQLERGRTRPGEFHEEPVTDGHATRVAQRVLFAGRAGNRDRVPAQLRRHDPQSLAERHGQSTLPATSSPGPRPRHDSRAPASGRQATLRAARHGYSIRLRAGACEAGSARLPRLILKQVA